jgi:hypothetical protein
MQISLSPSEFVRDQGLWSWEHLYRRTRRFGFTLGHRATEMCQVSFNDNQIWHS